MLTQTKMMVLVCLTASLAMPLHATEPIAIPPVPNPEVPPIQSMEQVVYGEPICCAHCTQHCACQKQTYVVCEMKKVKKTVFDCETEDVCGLLPQSMLPDTLFGFSLWGSKKVGCGEDGCGDCAAGCCTKSPKAGHCRSRKVLVKKTIVVEVPVYKCVVEYSCDSCGNAIDVAELKQESSQASLSKKEEPRVATLPRNQAGYGE